MHIYGSDQEEILQLQKDNPEYEKKLHKDFEFTIGEVVWAVRKEMARTIDDVLARRTTILYLDAKASVAIAKQVASIMAKELKKDKKWEEVQVQEYTEMSKAYIMV